ncbi:MAG TPA: hybrid sensor histidine kinase/response regulator [Xanthomonadaceae bacterium]|nr:hybrid sensor histidine kinase/response regulator [Xanthomonadaceae bacterium]
MNLSEPATAASADDPAKILIVDDIRENLVAMEALLQREGVRVLSAASGPEALELLLEHDFAVALLDVHMPEMDGFALAELMRGPQRSRQVPIIFLTASPNDPMRSFKGYETGAVDFLHKPIEPHVILGKVKVFIELYRKRRLLDLRNASLERALKLNETLLAVLTHDLRTPMSVVLLCAEKLSLEIPEDSPAQRTLQYLESSGRRMARMVEQLLDFSRIRSNGLRMAFAPCDLGEIADGAVAEAREAHPGATIQVHRSGDLDCHIDGDRMLQVVANLVGNAVIHGGGAVEVHLDGSAGDALLLSVRNPGRIAEDLLPRLFEPFKSTFNESNGLGLGLFIAHQFVAAHGGSLRARNDEGQVVFEVGLQRRGRPAAG